MKKNRVFGYFLRDAWLNPLCNVSVSEDGIVQYRNEEEKTQQLQLEKRDVDRIKEIILEHSQILSYEDLEFPSVLDGVINLFDFRISNKRKVRLVAFNIGQVKNPNAHFMNGWMEESDLGETVTPVKAMEVVKTFEEIAAILVANGVDAKCLRLTYA